MSECPEGCGLPYGVDPSIRQCWDPGVGTCLIRQLALLKSKLSATEAKLAEAVDGYRQLAEYFQETMNCATATETIMRDCYRDARDMATASFEEFKLGLVEKAGG